jgi:3-hydroxyacyl-CoA dehydrogenase
MPQSLTLNPIIAIIGGGNIGVAFAIVFASAGSPVRLYDPDCSQRENVAGRVALILADLQSFDLLDETPEAIAARITVWADLADAIQGSAYVQECAPESRLLKEKLFEELDRLTPADVVLASASSAMPVSEFASHLSGRSRCLVVHPGNPPFLLRVVEVVPAPFTEGAVVDRAMALLESAGLTPVVVRKEIKGFVFNRLQGAVLREAYCLVRDGVASVEDIDRLVRDGLGLRWAVAGPFEVADLNTTGGIARHAERLGAAYAEMGAERGQQDPWTPDLVAEVQSQRRRVLPLEQWGDRVRWRDRSMMLLLAARRTAKGME